MQLKEIRLRGQVLHNNFAVEMKVTLKICLLLDIREAHYFMSSNLPPPVSFNINKWTHKDCSHPSIRKIG